jgi:hypothetical protein
MMTAAATVLIVCLMARTATLYASKFEITPLASEGWRTGSDARNGNERCQRSVLNPALRAMKRPTYLRLEAHRALVREIRSVLLFLGFRSLLERLGEARGCGSDSLCIGH